MRWILVGLAPVFLMEPSVFAHSLDRVDLRDDAYHFSYFADGEHDVNYLEWWYFNLYDEVQGIQIAFTYSILDPEDYSTLGRAGVGAIAFTPGGSFTETRYFAPESFHASTERADVVISDDYPLAENYIEVVDEDTYRIVGRIGGEHSMSWDLMYLRQSASWFGRRREKVGIFPWEQMSWLVYMPGAFVSGELVLDGEAYHFEDVRGYHDHNWGEWILTTVMWNWAQYFESGLSLSMGDFRNGPVGVVSIDWRGARILFEKDEYRLLHTRWEYDGTNRQWYPTRTWLRAQSEGKILIVKMQTLDTEAVLPPPDIPFPLARPIIYEQTAHYVGGLWERNQRGEWEPSVSFSGNGFKEYTARQWLVGGDVPAKGGLVKPRTSHGLPPQADTRD